MNPGTRHVHATTMAIRLNLGLDSPDHVPLGDSRLALSQRTEHSDIGQGERSNGPGVTQCGGRTAAQSVFDSLSEDSDSSYYESSTDESASSGGDTWRSNILSYSSDHSTALSPNAIRRAMEAGRPPRGPTDSSPQTVSKWSNRSVSSHSSIFSLRNDAAYQSLVQAHSVNLRQFICTSFSQRTPKGKGSLLVFILIVLESAVFYGSTGIILRTLLGRDASNTLGNLLNIIISYCAGRLFYPVAGVLADTYFGRFRAIQLSLWLFWFAFAILALAQSVTVYNHLVLPVIGFTFIAVASGSFEVNLISFGVEQLPQGASSAEMSGYFYWYYFGRQCGVFSGLSCYLLIFIPTIRRLDVIHDLEFMAHVAMAVQSVLAVLLMTVALILVICRGGDFYKDRPRDNPLKLLRRVLWFTITVKRKQPIYRRAFRYGESRKPRIELAKRKYDGIFTNEEVENVKTFFQISLLIYSLVGFFLSYGAVSI